MRGVVSALVCLLVATDAWAQPVPSAVSKIDPEFEKQAIAEVAAISPAAATAFERGNAARESNRIDDAIAAYKEAIALAPNVDHPHRRLCGVYVFASRIDEGVLECETALALAPTSPYDRSTLAMALLLRRKPGDDARSVGLARQAADAKPDEVYMTQVWCLGLAQVGNTIGLLSCSERLLKLEPDGAMANFYAAGFAAQRGDLEDAKWRLEKAKTAGLPPSMYSDLESALEQAEEKQNEELELDPDVLWAGAAVVGAWLVGLLVLFGFGMDLSKTTLLTVAHAATHDAAGTPSERRRRRIYRIVLAILGAYFYLSMPVLIVGILAFGVGALVIFDAIGAIPIGVMFAIAAIVILTIGAVLRSLLVKRDTDPGGKRVDFARYPQLRAMLDEVAAEIGTRPVDTAYLVPGTPIAVSESGGLWSALRGKRSERVLILGVGVFEGMTQLQLRSILAHEYGHFHNEDTAGGGFALAARRSLLSLVEKMAKSGVAHNLNPAWWFVRVFYRLFLGVSQGASRLQEVLADRWAVRAYGSAAFVDGFRHTVARSVEFEQDLDATLKEAIENKWGLANLYEIEPNAKKPPAELDADVAREMSREPSLYDSHPSPVQRITWAEQYAVSREPRPEDTATVWSMFPDADAVERAMTAIVRDRVRETTGIAISDHAAADDEDAVSA